MNKKHFIYLAAFAAVLVLCLLGLAWQNSQPKAVAEIYFDGALVRTVSFAELTQPVEIPVGDGNTVCADAEGIWMAHADCPDQLCVEQGKIHSGNLSIVCLPNRVTVTLKNAPSGWDGVAG